LRKSQSTDDFELRGVAAADVRKLDHDVTHFSYGLLTNPVDGGLKTDLSLAFEHGNADAGNVFVVEDYNHPDAGSIDVRGPTWSVFQDHYNLYKQMSFSSGIPSIGTTDPMSHGALSGSNADSFYISRGEISSRFLDPNVYEEAESIGWGAEGFEMPRPQFVQRQPVYLGHIIVISMIIEEEVVDGESVDVLKTVLNPVAILWNPYNVELELASQSKVRIEPNIAIEYRFNGDAESYKGRASVPVLLARETGGGQPWLWLYIPNNERFAPGELKLYSANGEVTSKLMFNPSTTFDPASGVYMDSWMNDAHMGLNDNRTLQPPDPDSVYVDNGLVVSEDVTSIDIAISPFNKNNMESHYESGSNTTNRYYQKFYALTQGMGTGPTGVNGIFGELEENGGIFGKVGVSFVANQPRNNWTQSTPYPVGVYNWTTAAASNENNHLQVSSAVDMYLMSNPRAPFSTSEVGTYLHYSSNPYTTLEPQTFDGGPDELQKFFLDSTRPHYGLGYSSDALGQNRPVAWEFPLAPLTSIAQLQHVFFNTDGYEPSYAVGNSLASAYVSQDESISSVEFATNFTGSAIDFSYLLNEALWDNYFFSSIAPTYDNGSEEDDLDDAIDAFAGGTGSLQNTRMQAYNTAGLDSDALKDPATNPEQSVAAHLMVEGAFNVNSTSIPAWRAFLGSAYNQPVVGMKLADGGGESLDIEANDSVAAFSRFSRPTLDESHYRGAGIQDNEGSGYRTLDATELNELATQIVAQVRAQGPFVSLADFINRELLDGDEGLMGPLQQAINDAGLNDEFSLGLNTDYGSGAGSESPGLSDVFLNPEAGTGDSYGAGPGYLLQGDLLNSLGPFLTVKSNTFTIRTYGEASNPVTGASAEVYLEATVQQVPEFVDAADAAETPVDEMEPDSLTSEANKIFGRQFKIVNIRYLDPSEI